MIPREPKRPRSRVFDEQYQKPRAQKRKSKKQERRVMRTLGGSRQPLSGSHQDAKGDGVTRLQLIEAKRTAAKSIRIERKWLEKIAIEAMAVGRTPGFTFEFDAMDTMCPKDWVCVPAEFLRELTDAAE